MMNHGWGNDGPGWGVWLMMGLLMLAFWGAVAVLVVDVVGNRRHGHAPAAAGPADSPEHALQILDERFARGEIGVDEYEQRRTALRNR